MKNNIYIQVEISSTDDIETMMKIEEKYYCAIDSDRKTNRIIFPKYVKFISINRDNKLKILGI